MGLKKVINFTDSGCGKLVTIQSTSVVTQKYL